MAQHDVTNFLRHFTIIFLSLSLFLPNWVVADNNSELKKIDKSIRIRDYNAAVKQLQPLIKNNNAEAQYRLAGLYRAGRGVKKNLKKAINLYERASRSGHANAQFVLASLMEKQATADFNITEIKHWYKAAADQGHKKARNKLIDFEKSLSADNRSDIDTELLFSTIRNNDIEQVARYIQQGVNFNITDQNKRSPLLVALLSGHEKLSAIILPQSNQANRADINSLRPIHVATTQGYEKIIRKLIDRKVNINAKDALGNTALMIATRHDDKALIELLLKNKADPQVKNKKNQTAPQIAQKLNLSNAKKLFTQYKIPLPGKESPYAKVDLNTFQKMIDSSGSIYKGWPVINIASVLGEVAIVRQLINNGSNINATDPVGNTPLHRAASKGKLETVKLLISNGSHINTKNKKNETPVYVAATSGHTNIIRFLLTKDADTSILAKNKSSALSSAIIHDQDKAAHILVNKKLDKESLHQALLLAIQHKMENLSIKLIAQDSYITHTDNKNRSALWLSADLGMKKLTAELLKNNKVEINQIDRKGYTPLSRAVFKGYPDISQQLIEAGASIDSVTNEKNTLLMLAVLSTNTAIIKMILTKNIDINAKNNSGDTALMLAAATGQDETVLRLIEAGADMRTRNQDDLNAYQIAQNEGHEKTAELIRQHSDRLFKLFN